MCGASSNEEREERSAPPLESEGHLELDTTRELQLTWVCGAVGVRTGRYTSWLVDIAAWIGEVDMVEGIETVSPELEGYTLVDEKVLLDREIRVEKSRSPSGVTACGPDLIHDRNRERAATSSQVVSVVEL
jgi:hypothetical protein